MQTSNNIFFIFIRGNINNNESIFTMNNTVYLIYSKVILSFQIAFWMDVFEMYWTQMYHIFKYIQSNMVIVFYVNLAL